MWKQEWEGMLMGYIDKAWDSFWYFCKTIWRNSQNLEFSIPKLWNNYCWAWSPESGHMDMMIFCHAILGFWLFLHFWKGSK